MKKSLKWVILSSALVWGLSGCTSTTTTSSSSSSSLSTKDGYKAASYNAQLGVNYLQIGRLDLAKEYLEKALRYDPKSIEANHYYALLQERLGDNTLATRHFVKAVRASKTPSSELMNNYGSHLCRVGQYTEAINAFKTALRDPLYVTPEYAYANIGVCLMKQDQIDEAEGYFQQALDKNDKFALALYQLADVSYRKHDYAKAQALWFRYRDSGPQTAESLLLCTQISVALQDNAQAEQCTNTLLARFPTSAEAQQLN